jgi:hypothetical protein
MARSSATAVNLCQHLRVVRHRLTAAPFATLIAAVGVNSAVSLFTQPQRVPAHALLSPYDYVWAVLYGAGGVLMLAGLAGRRANLETAGCVAFAGGSAISALAWALVGRWPAWNTVVILLLFAGAALIRAGHIARGRVLVLVEPDGVPGRLKVVEDDPR